MGHRALSLINVLAVPGAVLLCTEQSDRTLKAIPYQTQIHTNTKTHCIITN